jgi:hypothetical protein
MQSCCAETDLPYELMKGAVGGEAVSWTAVAPLIALVALVFTWGQDIGPVLGLVALLVALVAVV